MWKNISSLLASEAGPHSRLNVHFYMYYTCCNPHCPHKNSCCIIFVNESFCVHIFSSSLPPSLPQGELVDHTPHLLPAGQRSGEGEVVQWTPRPPGAIMAGVSLTVEGTRDFKVSDVIMT